MQLMTTCDVGKCLSDELALLTLFCMLGLLRSAPLPHIILLPSPLSLLLFIPSFFAFV